MRLDPSDKEAIEEIVDHAVTQTLLKLGIDVSTPEKITQFQSLMAYLANWREQMRSIQSAGLTAAAGTVAVGILAAIWLFITGRHP